MLGIYSVGTITVVVGPQDPGPSQMPPLDLSNLLFGAYPFFNVTISSYNTDRMTPCHIWVFKT